VAILCGVVHSFNPKFIGLGSHYSMVFQVIYLNIVLIFVTTLRRILKGLAILQQWPFLVLGGMILLLGRWGYAQWGWHRSWVMAFKWLLRVAFWLRGMSVVPIGAVHGRHAKGIQLINISDPLSAWILFSQVPYDHLISPPDAFFESSFLNPYLFLLGFIPQEHGVSPNKLATFESRLTPYLDQGFTVWQMTAVEYRDTDSLPYGVVMAIKHHQSLTVWKMAHSIPLDRVHWCHRQRLEWSFLTTIPMSKRMSLTIATVHHTLDTHFGPTVTEQRARLAQAPGMPPSPASLAKQMMHDATKTPPESETESLAP
jgi:hypothetical protein